MNKDEFETFSGGVAAGALTVLAVVAAMTLFHPKGSMLYREGVSDTHKEACANGLMIKEVAKDDTVIYRWLELHKQPE